MESLVCSKCGAKREGGRCREGDVCGAALRPSLWARMFRSGAPWKHCTGVLRPQSGSGNPTLGLDLSTLDAPPSEASTQNAPPTHADFGGGAGFGGGAVAIHGEQRERSCWLARQKK
jgi:hypothetical protein